MKGVFSLKIVFIGNCNSLAAKLVDKLVKEEHDVYIISSKDFTKDTKPTLSYRLYTYQSEELGVEKVFASIKPNVVVFASSVFASESWGHDKESNAYLSQLINVLNLSAINEVNKFIYLSSNQVYPSQNSIIPEATTKKPEAYKGILCSQGEEMVANYKSIYNLEYVILRVPSLYGFAINENEKDIVSNIVNSFYDSGEYVANTNNHIISLHIKDCVEAIFRAKDVTPSLIYNVGESVTLTEADLARKINATLVSKYIVSETDGTSQKCFIDCSKIKSELEWVQFHNIDTTIKEKEIDFTRKVEKVVKSKKTFNHPTFLQSIENIVVFAFFAFLTYLCRDDSVLRNVDFFTIYIVLIALLFGIRQSILSVIFLIFYKLLGKGLSASSFIDVLIDVNLMLQIAQYMFLGVAVGYIVDQYKSVISEKNVEYEFLKSEFKEITDINNDNIIIKQEYEKRLLNYKTSLPKLHLIVSQLNVLEPEKIFAGIVSVVRDVMDTDTVSVYSVNPNSQYARLIVSANNESIFQGKSINLRNFPKLMETLSNNEIFVGSQWSKDEPSFAAPIFDNGKFIAIILIKEMPFNSLTLYQINLFRTLTALITSAISIADSYESATRDNNYYENTEILVKNEFEKLIQIKKEEKKKGLSDYTLIKIEEPKKSTSFDFSKLLGSDSYYGQSSLKNNSCMDLYHTISGMFRDTDFFGVNENNELIVLLGNTLKSDVDFVVGRLKQKSLNAMVIE